MSYHTNLTKLAALGLLRQSNEGGATEDNNQKISRGSPTDLFFIYLISLVDVVSVMLNEGNNQNFARGYPTEISFFYPLLASLGNATKAAQLKITTGILQGVTSLSSFLYLIYLVGMVPVPLTEENNHNFARGSPT